MNLKLPLILITILVGNLGVVGRAQAAQTPREHFYFVQKLQANAQVYAHSITKREVELRAKLAALGKDPAQEPAKEKLYRAFLEDVQKRLAERGIVTRLKEAPATTTRPSFSWLEIEPGLSSKFNQLAYQLSRYQHSLRYFNKFYLSNYATLDSSIKINDRLKRWYLSARAFDDPSFSLSSYAIINNLNIVQGFNTRPWANEALTGQFLFFRDVESLADPPPHPRFPEASYIIDEDQQIYVIKNSAQRTRNNPHKRYSMMNFHRAMQKVASYANMLLHVLNDGKTINHHTKMKLAPVFFSVAEDLAWFVTNANTALYLLLERPANTRFVPADTNHKVILSIRPQAQAPFAYAFLTPRPPAHLVNGDPTPILNSRNFQMFIRYYLNLYPLFHESITAAAKLDELSLPELRTLLERLSSLNRMALPTADAVDAKSWSRDDYRQALRAVQAQSVADLAILPGLNQKFSAMDCATLVRQPTPPKAEIGRPEF